MESTGGYGQYTAAQWAAMTPEQQYALQQHWQQWEKYQQEYALWHSQYGEQYKREMAAAAAATQAVGVGGAIYTSYQTQPQPPPQQSYIQQPPPPPPPDSDSTQQVNRITGQPQVYSQPQSQPQPPPPPPNIQNKPPEPITLAQQPQQNQMPVGSQWTMGQLSFNQPPPSFNQQPPSQQYRQPPPPFSNYPSNQTEQLSQTNNDQGNNRRSRSNNRNSERSDTNAGNYNQTTSDNQSPWGGQSQGGSFIGNNQPATRNMNSSQTPFCSNNNSGGSGLNPNNANCSNSNQFSSNNNGIGSLNPWAGNNSDNPCSSSKPNLNNSASSNCIGNNSGPSSNNNFNNGGTNPWANNNNLPNVWSNNGPNNESNNSNDATNRMRNGSNDNNNWNRGSNNNNNNNDNNFGNQSNQNNRWGSNQRCANSNNNINRWGGNENFGNFGSDDKNNPNWRGNQQGNNPSGFNRANPFNSNQRNFGPNGSDNNSFNSNMNSNHRFFDSNGGDNNPFTSNSNQRNFGSNSNDNNNSSMNRQQRNVPELDEESFDRQFKQWENQFEDWKRANANHPDRDMYKRYENEFEKQRQRIMERREQMRRRKMEQMGGLAAHTNVKNELDNYNQQVPPSNPQRQDNNRNYSCNEGDSDTTKNMQQNNLPISHNMGPNPERPIQLGKRKSRFNAPHQDESTQIQTNVITLDDEEKANNHSSEPMTNIFKKIDGIPGLDLVSETGKGIPKTNQAENVIVLDADGEDGPSRPPKMPISTNKSPNRKPCTTTPLKSPNVTKEESVSNISNSLSHEKNLAYHIEVAAANTIPDVNNMLKDPNFLQKISEALAKAQGKDKPDSDAPPPEQFIQQLPELLRKLQEQQDGNQNTTTNKNEDNDKPLSFAEWQRRKGQNRSISNDRIKADDNFSQSHVQGPTNTKDTDIVKRTVTNSDGNSAPNLRGNGSNSEGNGLNSNNGRNSNINFSNMAFNNQDGGCGGGNGVNFRNMSNASENGPDFDINGRDVRGHNGPNRHNGPNFRGNGNGSNFGGPNNLNFNASGGNFRGSVPNYDGNGPNFRGHNSNFDGNGQQFRGNGPNFNNGRIFGNNGPNGQNFGGNGRGHNFGGGGSGNGNNNQDFNSNNINMMENPFRREDGPNRPVFNAENPGPKNNFRQSDNFNDGSRGNNNGNTAWTKGPNGGANRGNFGDFYRPMQVIDYQNCPRPAKVIDYGHKTATPATSGGGNFNANTVPDDEFKPVKTFEYGHAKRSPFAPASGADSGGSIDNGPIGSGGNSGAINQASAFNMNRRNRRNKKKPNNNNKFNKSQQGQEQLQQENPNQQQQQNPNQQQQAENDNTPTTNDLKTSDKATELYEENQDDEQAADAADAADATDATNFENRSEISDNSVKAELEEISDTEDVLLKEDLMNRDDDSPPPPPPPMFSSDRYMKPVQSSGMQQSIFPSTASANENIVKLNASHVQISLPSIENHNTITIDEILLQPGRLTRPKRICIILRGPPASGKSYVAKLIKEKETEMGGANPRILSIDDYFLIENDYEEKCPKTGKKIPKKEILYEYDEQMEETYMQYLIKSFKKTISDNLHDFIIVDCNNNSLRTLNEFYCTAKDSGFMPYIVDLLCDVETCLNRNTHQRSEKDIKNIIDTWKSTPFHYIKLDVSTLLENVIEMEDAEDMVTDNNTIDSATADNNDLNEVPAEKSNNEVVTEDDSNEGNDINAGICGFLKSKWETDNTTENLARLDGTNKLMHRRKTATMEDYLQIDDWEPPTTNTNGKKRVRWADIEEKRTQDKMRAIGFVVGQTDWNRMMDPNAGTRALNKTKYIERVNKQRH